MTGALLTRVKPSDMQTALVNLFANSGVQKVRSRAAVVGTVDVLLGSASPSWAPPVNPNALADFAGQLVATAVLGADNPGVAALSAVISADVSTLFAAVGGEVATLAGNAIITLLNQAGSPTSWPQTSSMDSSQRWG